MQQLAQKITAIDMHGDIDKRVIVSEITRNIEDEGYTVVELNQDKPWGAYIRIDGSQADRFVEEFFSGLTPIEARLGVEAAELSPKILIVAPGQRLSWQYHDRRAERWAFLTKGGYNKSNDDDEGDVNAATSGDIVQFSKGERHRLVGLSDQYVLVAEIWQHTDSENMSNEDDIVRLADDYKR